MSIWIKKIFSSGSCFCYVDVFTIQTKASKRGNRLARKDGGSFHYSFVSAVLKKHTLLHLRKSNKKEKINMIESSMGNFLLIG